MPHWTADDVPDQTGRTVVVTGGNSGLGLETVKVLAAKGADVVLACRTVAKGEAVAPDGVQVRALDLTDLASVRAFADGLDRVDVLVNNAGVMATSKQRTADGFELQIGTNHLGPFLLTALLADRITDRVVTVSSVGHRMGRVDLADLNWERRFYNRWLAYGQSKLANLLFTYEGQRRSAGPAYLAAHPGYANTNLTSNLGPLVPVARVFDRVVGQSAEMGALPQLMAATADLPGGTYVGPGGPAESRGYPQVVTSNARSRDTATAAGLWALSTELVGL